MHAFDAKSIFTSHAKRRWSRKFLTLSIW